MKATIKDVAKAAGVSTATVSNVLTQKKYVSDEITLKVKAVMKELGYQPNSIARSLKTNKSYQIGIMVPDITIPFFGEIVESAERIADAHGFQITLCTSENDMKKEKKIIETFLSMGVDGIINVAPITSDRILNKQLNVPMIIVDRPHFSTNKNIAFVYADNYKASAAVARCFLEKGYEKFLCISGYANKIPNAKMRLDGFCNELKKNGVSEEDITIAYRDFSFEEGYNYMEKYIAETHLKDRCGAFISSDIMAWGAMEAVKEKGFAIPNDIGIIGYDNIYFSKFLYPGLTTVENPTSDLGGISTNLLLEEIEKQQNLDGKYIILRGALVMRQSV